MNSGPDGEHDGVPRQQTKIRSFLADYRLAAGLTQEEMAWAIGISPASYIRLERGEVKNPPLGWLVNASFVLNIELDDLLEARLTDWCLLGGRHGPPPAEWYDRPEVIARVQRFRAERGHGAPVREA